MAMSLNKGVLHRDSLAKYAAAFLRNSPGFGSGGFLQNVAECLGAPLQIGQNTLPVPLLIVAGTGIGVVHSMPQRVVEEHRDLAGGGGDRLGFADARRETAVERSQRRVGAPNRHGGKPQAAAAARLLERRVRDDSTLPPEILLRGARPATM